MAIVRKSTESGHDVIEITEYDIVAVAGLVGGMLEHIADLREQGKIPGSLKNFMSNLEATGKRFQRVAGADDE